MEVMLCVKPDLVQLLEVYQVFMWVHELSALSNKALNRAHSLIMVWSL